MMLDSHSHGRSAWRWRRARRQTLLLTSTICCLGGSSTAAAKSNYLRHGSRSRSSNSNSPQRMLQQAHQPTDNFSCLPSTSGYYPTPGCHRYYWCDNGSRSSSMIYSCTEGLLFDETLGLCNWEAEVTCSLTASPSMEPSSPPTVQPAAAPTTAMPTVYTFQSKVLPHDKQVVGYWQGGSRSSSMTPDQMDYTKVTRINYATYTTNVNGKIYMKGANGSFNNEDDIFTLLGPYIWTAGHDGSKEYCLSNPNNNIPACTHHDYKRGMLHLAHLQGVEVYPSITLDNSNTSFEKLNKEDFTKSAMRLLKEYQFDGLDLHFELFSEQNKSLLAFQSLLSHLRRELIKLMVEENRSYGLSIAMPCNTHSDLNLSKEDVGTFFNMVDGVNLLMFDFYAPSSSDVTDASLNSDSVDSCVNDWWIDGGISYDKINAGLSFNGQAHDEPTEMHAQREGVDSTQRTHVRSDGKVEMEINGITVTGQYGLPRYYPIFGRQTCSDDEQTKPTWLKDDQLFSRKEECCKALFEWIHLQTCLGADFEETNFIQDPTLSPSMMPTISPSDEPTSSPSDSNSPSHEPSSYPIASPSQSPTSPITASPVHGPRASPFNGLERVQSSPTQIIYGLCAEDESELPQTYRTAQQCADDQPCPERQQCFEGINYGSSIGMTQQEAPSETSTSHPALPTNSPTASPGMAIQADADATLSEEDRDKIYGYHPMLVVDGESNAHYSAIMKFDISFMKTATVRDASLRLFIKDGSGYCGTFATIKNTWWMENSITYANAPAANDGIVIGQAWNVNSGEWFEMDITEALDWVWNEEYFDKRASTKYLSIHISSTVANRCIFSSSNGPTIHAPHLWIRTKDEEESSPIVTTTAAASSNAIADESVPVSSPTLALATAATKPSRREAGEALMLRATDDATIVKEKPNLNNLGNSTSLVVDNHAGLTMDVLIRFDITDMYQTAPKKAVLALYIEKKCESAGIFTTTSRFDANFNAMHDDWNENNVSWSTAPSYDPGKYGGGSTIGTFGQVQSEKWFGFDVLGSAFSWDTVAEQTTITFRVSSDDGKHCKFTSIQGGKAAKLMLEF